MLTTRNHPILLMVGIAILVAATAAVIMLWREPIPERQGTAPSVVTGQSASDTQALPGARGETREGPTASAGAARAARGSGVEGVPSEGVTLDPPSGR